VDAVVKEPEKKPPEKKPEPPKETLEERIKRMRESVKAPEKKEEPKKVEEKKPEPPKKTKEELLKERMDKMVKTAKTVNIKVPDVRSGNGKTDRKPPMTDKQIQDYLNKGYKPGSTTQIASSEMQYCISRIQQAIDARWREVMPRIGAEGTVVILARVNAQGRLVNCRLKDSCGDRTSDAAALTVVKTVPAISGLDREFLKKYAKEDLAIRYKVRER
jgi:TonB family protein